MRLSPLAIAAALTLAACGPGVAPTPGASPSAGASAVPTTAASASPAAVAASQAPTTSASPAKQAPVPVTVKATVDGQPANIEGMAYYTLAPGNTGSVFWNVGALAKYEDQNIGQAYGYLKEGEASLTIHMKMGTDGAFNLRTLSEAEYKGAANLVYKEGPKSWSWGANGATATAGSFTVENDVVTFTMTATMPADKRANDGKPRTIALEVSGLPRPIAP